MSTMKQIPCDWTPERVAELTRLFNEGVSFPQIADLMALTRNSVIGKCLRLGLSRESLPQRRARAAKTGHLIRKLRPRSDSTKNKTFNTIIAGPKYSDEPLPSTHESDLAIPKRRRKNIFTLTPTSCRFPIGDPCTPSFFFCGACKLPTLPYCAEHARRCFSLPMVRSPVTRAQASPTNKLLS